jgi:hypothetical protein
MKTASWSTSLPETHQRIGISRGAPRKAASGYRLYRKLAPGTWFNSVGPEEYERRYPTEILGPLDPRVVIQELRDIAPGMVPTLLCFERPAAGQWCHRAIAAAWLAEAFGAPVPEYGYEHLSQQEHPLLPRHIRAPAALPLFAHADVITTFIGRSATIDGVRHQVVSADPANPGMAIVAKPDGTQFSTAAATLRRYFT